MPLDAHLVLGGYQRRACAFFFIALICCETTFGTTLQFLLLTTVKCASRFTRWRLEKNCLLRMLMKCWLAVFFAICSY